MADPSFTPINSMDSYQAYLELQDGIRSAESALDALSTQLHNYRSLQIVPHQPLLQIQPALNPNPTPIPTTPLVLPPTPLLVDHLIDILDSPIPDFIPNSTIITSSTFDQPSKNINVKVTDTHQLNPIPTSNMFPGADNTILSMKLALESLRAQMGSMDAVESSRSVVESDWKMMSSRSEVKKMEGSKRNGVPCIKCIEGHGSMEVTQKPSVQEVVKRSSSSRKDFAIVLINANDISFKTQLLHPNPTPSSSLKQLRSLCIEAFPNGMEDTDLKVKVFLDERVVVLKDEENASGVGMSRGLRGREFWLAMGNLKGVEVVECKDGQSDIAVDIPILLSSSSCLAIFIAASLSITTYKNILNVAAKDCLDVSRLIGMVKGPGWDAVCKTVRERHFERVAEVMIVLNHNSKDKKIEIKEKGGLAEQPKSLEVKKVVPPNPKKAKVEARPEIPNADTQRIKSWISDQPAPMTPQFLQIQAVLSSMRFQPSPAPASQPSPPRAQTPSTSKSTPARPYPARSLLTPPRSTMAKPSLAPASESATSKARVEVPTSFSGGIWDSIPMPKLADPIQTKPLKTPQSSNQGIAFKSAPATPSPAGPPFVTDAPPKKMNPLDPQQGKRLGQVEGFETVMLPKKSTQVPAKFEVKRTTPWNDEPSKEAALRAKLLTKANPLKASAPRASSGHSAVYQGTPLPSRKSHAIPIKRPPPEVDETAVINLDKPQLPHHLGDISRFESIPSSPTPTPSKAKSPSPETVISAWELERPQREKYLLERGFILPNRKVLGASTQVTQPNGSDGSVTQTEAKEDETGGETITLAGQNEFGSFFTQGKAVETKMTTVQAANLSSPVSRASTETIAYSPSPYQTFRPQKNPGAQATPQPPNSTSAVPSIGLGFQHHSPYPNFRPANNPGGPPLSTTAYPYGYHSAGPNQSPIQTPQVHPYQPYPTQQQSQYTSTQQPPQQSFHASYSSAGYGFVYPYLGNPSGGGY